VTDETLTTDDVKKRLRKEALANRAEAADACPDGGASLRDNFLAAIRVPPGGTVSAYWPMRAEIDPRPLMTVLHAAGFAVGLPVMPGAGQPLVFRAWTPDAALVDGGFGTRIPPESAPEVLPDVLLVPLVAFDDEGYRLGYGGGFYDRTLEKLRASKPVLAVGVAFEGQRLDAVPRGPYDQPLDWIVTESGARRFGGDGA
jgi:5-formyltetrahydrofolate cyclo-ligase